MLLITVTVIVFVVLFILMPKQLSSLEMYTTSLFAICFGLSTDLFLDLKYHLYGYFYPGVDGPAYWFMVFVYVVVNLLFLNGYPLQQPVWKQAAYIGGWSVFSVLYEIAALRTGLLYYHAWKLSYSAALYPLLFLILLIHFFLVRRLGTKAKCLSDRKSS
ncbi:hypothetical protein M493_11835 [Geobacillus genomosp. 3]|uniref:Uncharacterized protein n=1 Tax=Geobacillus genomosp. 3 TaxID=1921421 RepID=S5ZEB2_GEOG3|nr:CBO0543 family protein [Geobacillus genomosp. 3]AGT32615.1 hypothetical protein M493_11835 [Geobacillus genomosp. 3]